MLLLGRAAGEIRGSARMRLAGRLVVSLLLIVSLELTMRSIPIGKRLLDYEWRSTQSFWDLRAHTTLLVDHGKNEVFMNAIGDVHERRKPEGTFRIVCLGSSSTEGSTWGIEDPQAGSYPAQLGARLQDCTPGSVEVINGGVSGYSLTQLVIFFEEVLSGLSPDMVILYFGWSPNSPAFHDYYRRVEAILERNPDLHSRLEIEAAMSLRWPNTTLVKTYLLLSRSRMFMGAKLLIDSLAPDRTDIVRSYECDDLNRANLEALIRAALKGGYRGAPCSGAHGGRVHPAPGASVRGDREEVRGIAGPDAPDR